MKRMLALCLALVLASCATTPPQPDPPPADPTPADPLLERYPELDEPLPWDSNVTRGTLDNGLTYYVEPRAEPAGRVEMWVAVRVGSLQEEEDQLGLAHVVEHMAFNGTRNFARNDLVKYLEGVGVRFGPHLNAHTSFGETVYKLQLPTDDPKVVNTGFVVLADWAQGLSFDRDEIERERGVVLEEWRRGRGVGGRTRDAIMPVLFHGARHADRLPIGTEESLRGFAPEALERYYRDWYRPELMAVFVVGDVEPKVAEVKIQATFGPLVNPEGAPEWVEYELPIHEETVVGVFADPEQTSSAVSVSARKRAAKGQTRREYRDDAVFRLVLGVLNERLADVGKREASVLRAGAGRSYSSRTSISESVWVAAAEGALPEALDLVLVEVERLKRHGVTAAELDRARLRSLTGLEEAYARRDKETSRQAMGELLRNFTTDETVPGIGEEWSMAQRYLPGVSLEEANAVAGSFLPAKGRAVTCTLPKKEGLAVPTDGELLAVISDVEGREIKAMDSEEVVGEILATAPTPGSVTAKTFVEDPGFHKWTLSNGVTVILKPTDFEADNILFESFEPGGDSLAADDELIAAQTATALVRESGVGPFSSRELGKWLSGKSLSVSPYIGERDSGVRGSSRGADLETAMQLLHGLYTVPRFEAEAFEREKARRIESLRDRDARPTTPFYDRFDALVWSNHKRRQPWTATTIEAMDLKKSEAFYRARFGAASGSTLVFTGSFTLEQIEPLLVKYVASLPAGEAEVARDVGIRPAKGVQKDSVRAGLDPKAEVIIRFAGAFKSTPENRHAINALVSLLRVRLREELREARGGTYGVRVSATTRHTPVQDFGLVVSFQCDPARVDELVAAAYQVLADVKKKPVEAAVANRIQAQERRLWETELRKNGYWKAAIASNAQRGEDPADLTKFWGLYEQITPKYLQAAAKKYINTKRLVQVILTPAETAEAAE